VWPDPGVALVFGEPGAARKCISVPLSRVVPIPELLNLSEPPVLCWRVGAGAQGASSQFESLALEKQLHQGFELSGLDGKV